MPQCNIATDYDSDNTFTKKHFKGETTNNNKKKQIRIIQQ